MPEQHHDGESTEHCLPSTFLEIPMKRERRGSDASDTSHASSSSEASSAQSTRRYKNYQDLFEKVLPPEMPRSRSRGGCAHRRCVRVRLQDCDQGSTGFVMKSTIDTTQTKNYRERPVVALPDDSDTQSSDISGLPSLASTPQPSPNGGHFLEAVPISKAISVERRVVSRELRIFLFGTFGDEPAASKDRVKVLDAGLGSKEQIMQLYQLWVSLDADMSGSANLYDFHKYLFDTVTNPRRQHGLKVTSFLNDHGKQTFVVQDLMRIIWPRCTLIDLAEMRKSFWEEHLKAQRAEVPAPEVLPEEEREALNRIFSLIDKKKEEKVSFNALSSMKDDSGFPLVEMEQLQGHIVKWGSESHSHLQRQEFLEMMCPAGFRTSEDAWIGTDVEGNVVVRSASGVWHQREDLGRRKTAQ